MRKGLLFLTATGLWLGTSVSSLTQAAGSQATALSPTPAAAAQHRAVLDQYCVSCHNDRLKIGNLALDKIDLTQTAANSQVLESVVRKLRSGMMPPPGSRRPDQATSDALSGWLETSLDRVAAANPNPGRPLLHRLNRAEFANAIHDLLALDVDPATLLPPDDSSFGFDNVADVLGVSPALQERYLDAAEKISALAVGDPSIGVSDETFLIRGDVTQTLHIPGLPLGTRGGTLIRKNFPLDGEYQFKVKIWRTNTGVVRGLVFPHELVISIDGKQIFQNTIGGAKEEARLDNAGNPTLTGDAIDARLQVRVPVKAGPRTVVVTFIQRGEAQAPNLLQPFQAVFDSVDGDGIPKIDSVKITGPFSPTGPGETPSRLRVFVCRPARAAEEMACANTILSTLARRAYRRNVTADDMKLLLSFYERGRKQASPDFSQASFDKGIQLALRLILASPEFAFRAERDPAGLAAGAVYRVNDFELASRLSYFLWSSIPDDQLLDLASQGRLRNQVVLAQQVKRMLADPRARALTDNFAGQWLYLRNLRGQTPISEVFPDFDDNLRQAFRTETEMLFESIIHEDRSVVDLLNADYTFVNERLARHYGIKNVYGSHFRRVPVTDEARRGLLGQGSILTVTSRANRTSPVLRGKWILENLLGSPPPSPPANVPPLKEAAEGEKPRTVRAQMEEHRKNAVCASCHKLMDPLGFALENFDAVGAWRSHDEGTPIDASSELANGSKVDGVVSLRQQLLRRPEAFAQTITEKLLTYALGRGLDYHDGPAVRTIVRDAGRNNYRFSSIVLGIINSTPFQMRMKSQQEPVATSAARQ